MTVPHKSYIPLEGAEETYHWPCGEVTEAFNYQRGYLPKKRNYYPDGADEIEFYKLPDGTMIAIAQAYRGYDEANCVEGIYLVTDETDEHREQREARELASELKRKAAKAKERASKRVAKEAAIKGAITQLEKAGYKVIK